MMDESTIDTLVNITGWISTLAWGISFLPQCWINYRSKSVAGFSVEFAMLNPVGFYFYTVYSLMGYCNPNIGETGGVLINDLVFMIYAFSLSSVQFTQIFMYERGSQKNAINYYVVAFLFVLFASIITVFIIELNNPNKIS